MKNILLKEVVCTSKISPPQERLISYCQLKDTFREKEKKRSLNTEKRKERLLHATGPYG